MDISSFFLSILLIFSPQKLQPKIQTEYIDLFTDPPPPPQIITHIHLTRHTITQLIKSA